MSRGCAGIGMLRYSLTAVSLLLAFEGPFGDAYALDPSSSSTHILTGPTHPVFAPSSFWYARIPADAPLHPNSAGFLRDFLRQFNAYYGNVAINTSSYASPIYVVGPDVPTQMVTQRNNKNKKVYNPLQSQFLAVPIPDYAVPADGTDSEMTIYQPSTDTMWELYSMKLSSTLTDPPYTPVPTTKWTCSWGGRMDGVSKDDGIWTNPYGATATGLPFLGGQISVEELRRGHIPHAIGISLVQTESWKILSWPANRSDGYNPDALPNRIPEGLRFRLDPTIDVDALPLHPVAKTIAKAAQTYGFVVWDKGGAISLRAENPKRFTVLGLPNPYVALWNGTPSYAILKNFPWDKLQFLPMDYGKPQ